MPNNFTFYLIIMTIVFFFFLTINCNLTKETYDKSMTFDKMIDSYFKEFNMEDVKWKIIKEEEYNDRMSFLDIEVDDMFKGKLCFTIEKSQHRNELRLVLIENINDNEWKNKLQKSSFLLIHN